MILFVLGAQACIPTDPLAAAEELGHRATVFARKNFCGIPSQSRTDFREINLNDDEAVLQAARAVHSEQPLKAVVAYDDEAVPIAARIAAAFALPGHPVEVADAARDKCAMKQRFVQAGVPIAPYLLANDEDDAVAWASRVGFPVVVKPVRGSASQGVIRADNELALRDAYRRVRRIVREFSLDTGGRPNSAQLIESYLDGSEFSVELLVIKGEPEVLCVFEKPLPLQGPYFEETIYVTPPRISPDSLSAIEALSRRATVALGLQNGPAHCELRVTTNGIFVIEIAARLIGGACSRVFRYLLGEDVHSYVLRLALGEVVQLPANRMKAAGALMLPLPGEGRLKSVHGLEAARQITGIEDVFVTAELGDFIVPFPEQGCYVGFATASGRTPESVIDALSRVCNSITLELEPPDIETWCLNITDDVPAQQASNSSVLSSDDCSWTVLLRRSLSVMADSSFGEFPGKQAHVEAQQYLERLGNVLKSNSSQPFGILAEEEGAAFGWINGTDFHLVCLKVADPSRRFETAQLLLGHIIAKSIATRCRTITLDVDPRWPAQLKLYRRLGFGRMALPETCCHA
jgi:biotin carboxylase/ribosomal protein S18 acetylase RimI-like enzyme